MGSSSTACSLSQNGADADGDGHGPCLCGLRPTLARSAHGFVSNQTSRIHPLDLAFRFQYAPSLVSAT